MNYNIHTLSNGLTVITVPMADNPTATVLVMVEAGSKYETEDISGLSHFIEHMCFKGTANRPKAAQISEELDGIGAHYNAFTSQEFTGYYAKAHKRHLVKLIDVVSDLYLNPLFSEAEIEREKGVIVEEINMYEDLPHRKVGDVFMDLLYAGQPAAWNVLGTKETVTGFNRDHFVSYTNRHYVAPATTIVISGGIDENISIAALEEKCGGMRSTAKVEKMPVVEIQTSPQIKVEDRKTDQAHMLIGVRGIPARDSRYATMRVIEGVLGGGMSSRLFLKLREEMGICYYVRGLHDGYTDHGVLEVAAGVDKKRIGEAMDAILAELARLAKEKVSDLELKKVKDHLEGTLYLSLESSDSLAEFYALGRIIQGKLMTPDKVIEEIRRVTADDIVLLAEEVVTNERLNMAVVGQFDDTEIITQKLTLPL